MDWRISMIVLLFFLSGCQTNEETNPNPTSSPDVKTFQFDSEKWKAKEGQDYPHRDDMVEDIIERRLLKPLKKDSIISLLGQPDRSDGNYLFYTVRQKRLGMWPLHTKTLVIRLFPDSTENAVLIHE